MFYLHLLVGLYLVINIKQDNYYNYVLYLIRNYQTYKCFESNVYYVNLYTLLLGFTKPRWKKD